MLPAILRDVQIFLGNIAFISKGGCAIAALAIYKVAVKHNIPVKIIYLYNDESVEMGRYEVNDDALKGKGKHLDSCTHAVIEWEGKWYDAHSQITDKSEYILQHDMPEHMVIRSLKSDHWNNTFRRDIFLPAIEKHIGMKLMRKIRINEKAKRVRCPMDDSSYLNEYYDNPSMHVL